MDVLRVQCRGLGDNVTIVISFKRMDAFGNLIHHNYSFTNFEALKMFISSIPCESVCFKYATTVFSSFDDASKHVDNFFLLLFQTHTNPRRPSFNFSLYVTLCSWANRERARERKRQSGKIEWKNVQWKKIDNKGVLESLCRKSKYTSLQTVSSSMKTTTTTLFVVSRHTLPSRWNCVSRPSLYWCNHYYFRFFLSPVCISILERKQLR